MIDTDAVRAEVAEHLWRYLSAAAVASPAQLRLEDIPILRRGDVSAVRARAAAAVLQAIDAERALESIDDVLRRLPTSISFERQELQGQVSGRVDWTATRSRQIVEPSTFICRVPKRSSDLPLNRSLRAIIEGYLRCAEEVLGTVRRPGWGKSLVEIVGGENRLHFLSTLLRAQLLHAKVADIRPASIFELSRVEKLVGMGLDPIFARPEVLGGISRTPSTMELFALLTQHFLAPAKSDQLFEMLVATRIVRAMEDSGLRPSPWHFLSADQPFAEMVDEENQTWLVYWQRSHWTLDQVEIQSSSRYAETRENAGLAKASLRPDVVIVTPNREPVLVEAKYTATESGSREHAGIVEMMAYVYDMGPVADQRKSPIGVVVAHGSAAVVSDQRIVVCDESPESLRVFFEKVRDKTKAVEPASARSISESSNSPVVNFGSA